MAPLLVASSTSTSTSYLHSHSHSHSHSHPNLRSFYHPFPFSFSFHKMKMIKLNMKSDGRTAAATTTALHNATSQSSNPKVNVRALSSALHNAKSADDVAQLLNHHNPNPAHLPLPVYTTLIKYLGIDQRLDAAFALLQWLKQNQTISLNLLIYNSLLNAVRLNKEFDRIDHVIRDMKSQGFEPNIVTYNTLMSSYIDQRKPQEVFNLFSQIQINANLSPSPATYSIVLSAYKQIEDADGALQFFIKFRENYHHIHWEDNDKDKDKEEEFVKMEDLTVQICQSLMRKWLVNKELLSHTVATHKVLRFLTCMDKADVKLKRHFFERLVWACTHEEHYPVIRELYKRLRESSLGGDISLSVCNHIIWLMGKAKKWWAALEVYEEMLNKGPMPNHLSFELLASNFTVLMTSAGRRGLWRWALKLLKKMHEKGLTPGSREWNAVLIACAKAGETDAAVKIFQLMVEEGEKPTVHSYVALLTALGKGKLYGEAIRVWDHMLKVGVKPNLHAYTILASIYAKKGDHDTIELVLQEMTAAKIEPTVVTFNAIISGCVKGQMGATAAYEWFHKMKGRNVKPNEVSYETVIGALANEGKPRLAYQMYVKAYNDGLVLNQKAYDVVVYAGRVAGVRLNLDDLGFFPVGRSRA